MKNKYPEASQWIGRQFPKFSLPDQDNKTRSLEEFLGKYLVVYTYPRDDTPGCTAESCGFQDALPNLRGAGVAVVGISILDVSSKAKFAKKHGLAFPLLADPESEYLSKLGVWKEKSMLGKTYMGVSRETFIVDPDGKVAMHWPKAEGSGKHAKEVLAWLKENALGG